MNSKLNCILLIDDDEATNFMHRLVLEELDCAEQIIAVQRAQDGLTYLTRKSNDAYPQPDLIFLDINMPGMNGWEFMDAYDHLEDDQKARIVVVMLTTSLNPDDKDSATKRSRIKSFMRKPLTEENVVELLRHHFPEKFSPVE